MKEIVVASTSDSQEAVNAAAGNAPVETEVADEQTPPQQVESETPEATQEKEEKLPKKFLKRLDKLTAEKSAAERLAAELKGRLEEVEKRPPSAPTKTEIEAKAPESTPKPTPDKFETYEDYVEALSDWKYEQRVLKAQQEEEKEAITAYQKEVSATYNQHAEAAKEKYEDWAETIAASDLVLPPGVGDAIIELENGPDVAYFLAKHPEEGQKLLEMSPQRAIAEVGRISLKIAEPEKPAQAAPTTNVDRQPIVSKAPAPVAQLKGHGAKPSLSERDWSDPNVPQADYIKWRNEQAKANFRR